MSSTSRRRRATRQATAVLENALALTLAVVILALMAAAVAAGGIAALAEAATRLDRAGPQAVARR
jgi:hypothetical protein